MLHAATFENVGKQYRGDWFSSSGPIQAVKGINLKIPSGCVYGLLGPNRAGKTTLIKMLLSLCKASEGTITRLGQPVSDTHTLGRIGYMHENQSFPRYLNATEILHFYGSLTLVSTVRLRTKVPELLEKVGLADRAAEPISRFSKGMVQRLGLAQALLNDPELLILDEPTEGLDLTGRRLLREIIAERKARGLTVLLVSHVLSEVEQTCDRVAVIVRGRVVREDTVAELLTDPKSREKLSLEAVLLPLYTG